MAIICICDDISLHSAVKCPVHDFQCSCSRHDPRSEHCPVHSHVERALSGTHNVDTCPIYNCDACRIQNSSLPPAPPPPTDPQSNQKFHGILRLSEEALLEALGITDSRVSIRAVNIPFANLCINIQLCSPEIEIDVGDGSIIQLHKVAEGAEVPFVQPVDDPEQRENSYMNLVTTGPGQDV